MIKTGWKKLAIWALVISTLSGVVVGSQVMAIKTSEALEKMKEAGKIQLVTNVFSKCVQGRIDQPYKDTQEMYAQGTTSTIPKTPLADNPFNELRKHIPVGAWLEKQVQGKINNGTIYCEDKDSNIVNVFANTLGVDKAAIYCDGKKPGIFKLQNQNSKGEWVDVDGECAAGLSNGDLKFVFNDEGALAHVKKLYNKKKQDNSYLVAWGDRGTFKDDLINYFLYFNDFTAACSNDQYSGDESLLNKTKYFGPIKVPNPSTGNMDERYYSKGHITSNSWGSNWINSDGAHTCDAVIKRINDTAPAVKKALDKTEKDEDGTKPDDIVGDITEDADKDNAEEASPCSKAGQSLSWIMCPVAQVLSTAISGSNGHGGIYGSIEDNYLQVNSGSFKSNDNNGSYGGWKKFRDYTNIVFVIALVVIILSQITGFGVSNYGIKKMLPSLITVAVLVNISFFLCQLAVDLSNIVGYSINDIFTTIGNGVTINADFGDASIGTLVNKVFSTLIAEKLSIAGALIAYNTWEFWLPPFLLLLITTVIGILFFYVLLGVRQAGIVLLVALAPVAIVCYVLPNTKKFFERWWKMFFSLLLVYPICGLLIGGGRFASKLLLSTVNPDTSFFYTLIAILIQVVPFFFIPSVLRSSFQAIGNLGNRLSMLGNRLGRGATGAIRRSEGYKGMRTRLGWRNAERALGRQTWRDSHGLSVRGRASRWAGQGGVKGAIGDAAKKSRNRSQERRINAVAERHRAEQNAAFVAQNGLNAAERRERDAAMKNYESNYRGDDVFMNDFAAQSRAYDAAIDEVDRNPADMNARAQLRALQNVLGSSADGQDIIQNVLHRRLAAAQSRGDTTVSAGMVAAGQTLMGDHGGFKSGNRGLNKLSLDLASGKALESGHGSYQATAMRASDGSVLKDKAGNQIYENNHYGAAAAKGSAAELAGANDSTLQGMLSSIQNGNMSASDMSAVYRNASEAITNDNISVKPENEDRLNQIRQAVYGQLQSNAAGSADYYDSQGRTFTNTGGNNYQYTDAGGAAHNFTRDAATGNFTEVGGAGEVINGSDMMTASENFTSSYGGNYRDLHASDEFKVSH